MGRSRIRRVLILCAGIVTVVTGAALTIGGSHLGLIVPFWAALIFMVFLAAGTVFVIWWGIENRQAAIDAAAPRTVTKEELDHLEREWAARYDLNVNGGMYQRPTVLDDMPLSMVEAHLNELTGDIPRPPRGSTRGSSTARHRAPERPTSYGQNPRSQSA